MPPRPPAPREKSNAAIGSPPSGCAPPVRLPMFSADRRMAGGHRPVLSGLPLLLLLLPLSPGPPSVRGADASATRRQQVEAMSAEEKQELAQKRERFERLPPAEQDQLRELHTTIATAEDGKRLQGVMERYTAWLATLPAGQRADLLRLPAEQRVAEIKRLVHEEEKKRLNEMALQELTQPDLAAILAWVDDLLTRREAEILAKVPTLRERLAGVDDPKRRRMALYFSLHRGTLKEVMRPEPADVERLSTRLSPKARQSLENARVSGTLPQLGERWMQAALHSQWRPPPVPEEELRRFFHEKLDARQRQYFESLPAERMRYELTHFYYADRFRQYWANNPPPFGRPGSGFRSRGPFLKPPDRQGKDDSTPSGPPGPPPLGPQQPFGWPPKPAERRD